MSGYHPRSLSGKASTPAYPGNNQGLQIAARKGRLFLSQSRRDLLLVSRESGESNPTPDCSTTRVRPPWLLFLIWCFSSVALFFFSSFSFFFSPFFFFGRCSGRTSPFAFVFPSPPLSLVAFPFFQSLAVRSLRISLILFSFFSLLSPAIPHH